ncbi:MAG: ribosome silencing factor [Thermoanaerobaculia bacterium]|nr:ribosome silencing factor [Thermoanaerobaculia bacterium]
MRSDAREAPDALDTVRAVAEAALSRKATELKVLDLSGLCDFADYFLICSGTNPRQVQAIGDAVDESLRRRGVRPLSIEGREPGRWMLLDYGDFLVHVFLEEIRSFYRLEQLWADGHDVTDRVAG